MTAEGHDNGDRIQVNSDQLPHAILKGGDANLAALRQAESQSVYLEQRGAILPSGVPCRITWGRQEEGDVGDVGDDQATAGDVFLTNSQILFVASAEGGGSSVGGNDFAIGATCITLHAMTEEPEVSIYLQLTEGNFDSEVTLVPLDQEACQALFDGLCKLVSLHPLQVNDEEDEGGTAFGGEFVMSDDMVWGPSAGFAAVNGDAEDGATEGERAAMLNRLDNLLVVRPDFEVQEGQFEDATEENDDEIPQ